MKWLKLGLPLFAFIIVCVFLALGLKNDPSLLPSPLIDKAAPTFSLPTLDNPQQVITNADLINQVWFLNVWASWCAACKVEHPLLLDMANQGALMIGLNYKDTDSQAMNWLSLYENPYQQVMVDVDGRVGIDFGVYGVPETFLIDQNGRIRYKHVGPVNQDDAEKLLSLYAGLLE